VEEGVWGAPGGLGYRNRLAGEVNLLDQDESAQVGKDQEMKVLKEIDELESGEFEQAASS